MHSWEADRHTAEGKSESFTVRFLDAVLASGKYVALGILFLLFLLLGQDMIHHRFTEGGWVNRHGTVRP